MDEAFGGKLGLDELLYSASAAEIQKKALEAREYSLQNILKFKTDEVSSMKKAYVELQAEKNALRTALDKQKLDLETMQQRLAHEQSNRTDLELLTKESKRKLEEIRERNELLKKSCDAKLHEIRDQLDLSLGQLKAVADCAPNLSSAS